MATELIFDLTSLEDEDAVNQMCELGIIERIENVLCNYTGSWVRVTITRMRVQEVQ